jgi:hypothetical protein
MCRYVRIYNEFEVKRRDEVEGLEEKVGCLADEDLLLSSIKLGSAEALVYIFDRSRRQAVMEASNRTRKRNWEMHGEEEHDLVVPHS